MEWLDRTFAFGHRRVTPAFHWSPVIDNASDRLSRSCVIVFLSALVASCNAKHTTGHVSCGPGTTLTGDVCLPADATGRLVCGLGTHEEALACVPDAAAVSCGVGTERQGTECVALNATLFDLRLSTSEIPADGYSKIPVFALGRLADGTPATDIVTFGLSRPDAGSFLSPERTLTPTGIVSYFVPCNSALTPSCTGAFTATLALASAPFVLVARSVSATIVAPSGVGSAAACSGGGNVLFLDGDAGDAIHPGVETIAVGSWSAVHTGEEAPIRVEIQVEPSDPEQGTLWTTVFSTEDLGVTMTAQVYDDAMRADYTSPDHPGMEIREAAAFCNVLTGRFEVLDWQIINGTDLTRFTATFEQRCAGETAALRGCVHFEE